MSDKSQHQEQTSKPQARPDDQAPEQEMEDAQAEAAKERKEEGGYQ